MKALLALSIAGLAFLSSARIFGAEALPSFEADAAALTGGKQSTWKSEVLEVGLNDGSADLRILVIEFSTFAGGARKDPPHASAKLSLETPRGKGLVTSSSSLGDQNYRDVRLETKDDARVITFIRAIETIPNAKPKTQQILNKAWSASFGYELKNGALVLKGFTKEGTAWGVTQFTAPEREVTFKRVDSAR